MEGGIGLGGPARIQTHFHGLLIAVLMPGSDMTLARAGVQHDGGGCFVIDPDTLWSLSQQIQNITMY